MSARCNYNQINYNNISIKTFNPFHLIGPSCFYGYSILAGLAKSSLMNCLADQETDFLTCCRNTGSLRGIFRSIRNKWFKYTLFDISLLVFKFTFVIRIHFSKSGVFSIYLSAIVYSINYILKIEKGFQLSVFDAS